MNYAVIDASAQEFYVATQHFRGGILADRTLRIVNFMPFPTPDAAITSRMSIRAFTAQAVGSETLESILATAAQLVGGGETAPWKVHVLRGASRDSLCRKVCDAHDARRADPALGAHFSEEYDYYPKTWLSPYLERRRENGWGLYGLLGIGKADKDKMHAQHHRNYLLFDAPVGLMFTMHRSLGYTSLVHYGAFLQNIMIAARLHGLHTCPQAAWNDFAKIILPHVGAGVDDLLVCGMALGHADENAVVNSFYTPRSPVAEFTRWMV
jgi:nitroreductase